MLSLNEKDLGHALFFAIKKNDFEHAEYLLKLDAPVNTAYFIEQDRLAYTTSKHRLMQTCSSEKLPKQSKNSESPMLNHKPS